jgi:hypothetical protein
MAAEFLRTLGEIEETFRTWFHTADSWEEALSQPFRIDQASLREELLANRSRRDSDNSVIDELGFYLAMWTGHNEEEAGAVGFHCGSYAARISNSAFVSCPTAGPRAQPYLREGPTLETLKLIARCWEPDWGICASSEFRRELEKIRPRSAPFPAWMLYLSESRGPIPPLPPPSRIVAVDGLGSIIVTRPERLTGCAEDVRLAQQVGAILDGAGLLGTTELE